jgi:hypothetical protein
VAVIPTLALHDATGGFTAPVAILVGLAGVSSLRWPRAWNPRTAPPWQKKPRRRRGRGGSGLHEDLDLVAVAVQERVEAVPDERVELDVPGDDPLGPGGRTRSGR